MISRILGPVIFGGAFLLFLASFFLINKWKPEREENEEKRKIKKLIKSFLFFITIWRLGGFVMKPMDIFLDELPDTFYLILTGISAVPTFFYDLRFTAFLIGLLVAIKDFKKKKWSWVLITFVLIAFCLLLVLSLILYFI